MMYILIAYSKYCDVALRIYLVQERGAQRGGRDSDQRHGLQLV